MSFKQAFLGTLGNFSSIPQDYAVYFSAALDSPVPVGGTWEDQSSNGNDCEFITPFTDTYVDADIPAGVFRSNNCEFGTSGLGRDEITICFWAYPTGFPGYPRWVSNHTGVGSTYCQLLQLESFPRYIRAMWYDDTDTIIHDHQVDNQRLRAGYTEWNFLAFRYSKEGAKSVINKNTSQWSEVVSAPASLGTPPPKLNLGGRPGSHNNHGEWSGYMDEILIYPRFLSDDEVEQIRVDNIYTKSDYI